MEEDDEFGDLYTDVLRPLETSSQSHTDAPIAPLRIRPVDPDVNSDDEEIIYGASDLKNSIFSSSCAPGLKPNASIQEKNLSEPRARPDLGKFDLNLDLNSNSHSGISEGDGLELDASVFGEKLPDKGSSGGLNFMEDGDHDDRNIMVEERDNKDDDLLKKDLQCIDKQENMYSSTEQKETIDNYTVRGEIGSGQMIPGVSGKHEDHGGSKFQDEWGDSDESEDDLQIVLNDNNHGPMGMERMPGMDGEDDEDGDQLVIVADNGDLGPHHQQSMVEEQEWKDDEVGPGADGERKELGDASKASGGQPKIGYSNHLYHHHSFHSQFKYVRPGAAPLPGAVPVTSGGIQGQFRPPIAIGPGRGRGDWRPRGPVPIQKGLHPGYGVPAWGPNAGGRGFGSGLDFTLPSHKTIFEVDIDGFEEKPWKLPGVDISDFFNFTLNEESWKDYCKQLEQFRLETTMQSKIRVYESGRTEQDYDPDLPPELAAAAAAVGNQDIPSENATAGNTEVSSSDIARASDVQPPVPIGRPIPVETGCGDRIPSMDSRRPRMHDSDAIIEIFCQSSNVDDVAEQDNGDDLQRDDAERIDRFPHVYNGQKREVVARKEQILSRDDISREDDPHLERSEKGRKSFAIDDDGDKEVMDNQKESFDSEGSKGKPHLSSDGEGDDREREEMDVDVTSSDPLKDIQSRRPKNIDSRLEQPSRDNSSENGKTRSKCSNQKLLHGSFEDNARHYGRYKVREDSRSHRHMKSIRVEDRENGSRNWVKVRESESERDEYRQSRSQLGNHVSWLGGNIDQDTGGSRQRKMDDNLTENVHNKRRKGGMYTCPEKEEVTYNHNSSHRKRERDNTLAKSKDDDMHYSRQKEEERQNDRDEWHRNKQSHVPRSEKKEIRCARPSEDKKGSGREYNSKNVGRRRDRIEDAHGNHQSSNDEKRPGTSDERDAYASESSRKGKEQHSSLIPPFKRNQDEKSETAKSRGRTKLANVEDDIHNSSSKHREEASSGAVSKRGRSKMERWTSHQDTDFSVSSSSSFKKSSKDTTYNSSLASKKVDESFVDDEDKHAGGVTNNAADAKATTDDNHMDTVEKLKKRSERFKLPMPSEKEVVAIKKTEIEHLPCAVNENRKDLEIKPERPARKRRWTGN